VLLLAAAILGSGSAASPEDSNGNGNGSGGGEGIEDKAGEGSRGSLAKLEISFRIKAALMPRTEEISTIFLNHVFRIVGPILHYSCNVHRIIIIPVDEFYLLFSSPLLRNALVRLADRF
jgi:hypothetical protein